MTEFKRKYPRTTLKKILRGQSNKKIGKHVDALVYLDYIMFMEKLMGNAMRKAKESGEKRITAKDIRKVTMTTLRQFRG